MVMPCLLHAEVDDAGRRQLRLGHRLLDDYLDLVAARARPNTVLAVGYDLKVFFGVVGKEPVEVTPAAAVNDVPPTPTDLFATDKP